MGINWIQVYEVMKWAETTVKEIVWILGSWKYCKKVHLSNIRVADHNISKDRNQVTIRAKSDDRCLCDRNNIENSEL